LAHLIGKEGKVVNVFDWPRSCLRCKALDIEREKGKKIGVIGRCVTGARRIYTMMRSTEERKRRGSLRKAVQCEAATDLLSREKGGGRILCK